MNTLIILAITAAVFGLVIFSKLTGKGAVLMNAHQAKELSGKPEALFLDVRTPQEYAQGHIRNARHIPLAELGGRIAEIAAWKEKSVLVYCLSGGRSASAANLLGKNGFTKVYNLTGGIGAWMEAGFEVER